MKKLLLFCLGSALGFASMAQSVVVDSVFMGPGYRNEVYYNLEDGKRDTVFIRNWDIAFSSVGGREADFYAIFANHSNGVKVYKYPKGDISAWSTFDTGGWNSWNIYYNTDTSWNFGAFNRIPEKHPNYSWAYYTNNGELTGDSLWLITIPGMTPGSLEFYKFWPIERKASSGIRTWKFRMAKVDGSQDSTYTTDDKDFMGRNMSYFSIRNQRVINREPHTKDWNLLFTRYYGAQSDPQNPYYQVTGVLHNKNVRAIRISGIPRSQVTMNPTPMDTNWQRNISTIGYDWKRFDFNTNSWVLSDSLTYFVMVRHMDSSLIGKPPVFSLYKLFFTDFGGSMNGKVVMGKEKLATINTAVDNREIQEAVKIYPNPASQFMVVVPTQKTEVIKVYGLNGQIVFQSNLIQGGDFPVMLDCSQWPKGMYIAECIRSGGQTISSKILVF